MKHTSTTYEQLRRHCRDVALMSRLFNGWRQGYSQRATEADTRLDAIEAHLARLERTVTIAAPSIQREPARPETFSFAASRT